MQEKGKEQDWLLCNAQTGLRVIFVILLRNKSSVKITSPAMV